MRIASRLSGLGMALGATMLAGVAWAQDGITGLETVGKPHPEGIGFQPASSSLAVDQSRLRTLVAAHLSRSNNRPELARASLARAWGQAPEQVFVADQDDGIDWLDV